MTSDLLEPAHDDDLDRRLRAAMAEIAADYRPNAESTSLPRRRRAGWALGAAAAAIAMIGAAGVWVLDRDDRPAATETTVVVPPSPPWLAGLSLPDVPEPEWAVQLDPSLGVDDLSLNSPYFNWVTSREPVDSRWFVEATDGTATSYVVVSDAPAWTWDGRPSADDYELDGVEAQGGNGGNISWRTAEGVRTVASVGLDEPFVDEFARTAAAVDELDDLAVPDGFVEITQVAYDSWQGGDEWSAGVLQPAPDDVELMLSTWALEDDTAQPIAGGWLMGSDEVEWGWTAIVAIDSRAVFVAAPPTVDEATMRNIADLVTVVPAGDVARRPYLEDAVPVAGGEIAAGRWLATMSAPSGARVQNCITIVGAIELDGCDDGDADLTVCGPIPPRPFVDPDDAGRWAMVTSSTIDADAVLEVVIDGESADYTIEQSAGLTFVTGEVGGIVTDVDVASRAGTKLCPT